MNDLNFKWEVYEDFSGDVVFNNKEYFIFDGTSVPCGIEYKYDSKSSWDFFWGSFKEFKEFAKKTLMDMEAQNG